MNKIAKVLSCAPGYMLVAACILVMIARGSDNWGLMGLGVLLLLLVVPMIRLAEHVCRKENEKNPITTVEATVVGHRMETYRMRYSTSHTYYMTFQPEDGSEKLEFKVSESDYQDFAAGDRGPLCYRTWEYISFCAKDLSGVEPLAPWRTNMFPHLMKSPSR